MKALHPTLRSLLTNERGNVMMTFGLTSIVAIAAVGGAVDFGRAYKEKSRMQNALDAAVVSGVSRLRVSGNFTEAQTHALAVFRAVYGNAVQKTAGNNPTAGLDQPIVQFQQVGTQISGTVTMTTNTPFLKFMIGQDLSVGASSSGTPPSGKKLEVAMMVDLTGSMGWDAAAPSSNTPCGSVTNPSSKIDYLRCAGEDLLNILLPSSGANDGSVRIGIAPFSDVVNAGPYAAAATGLPATGGSYAAISNLKKTKQGPWTGSYVPNSPNTGGAQFGATGAAVPSGGTVSAGATYSNGYCAVPTVTQTQNVAVRTDNNNYRIGVEISRSQYDDDPSHQIAGIITLGDNAPSSQGFRKISSVDGDGSSWLSFINLSNGTDNKGYFVPLPVSNTGLTNRTRTANWSGNNRTGNIGAYVAIEEDNTISSSDAANLQSIGMLKATSNNGYWRLTSISYNGTENYEWKTSGWYIPLYETLSTTTTTTVVGCESETVQQPSSYLISCVTERKNGSDLDYTAEAVTTNRYVGPYNHGSSSKSNYSEDGKCYTAGRELPAVIPLTNNRSTLASFFQNAEVGGATAGHLGTAWASYLLSPEMNQSVFNLSTPPVAYNTSNVIKAAILMTDGEYNIQYSMGGVSQNISSKQALMLCKEMRSKGIKVYTIGFGFDENATPPSPNVQIMSDSQRTTPLTGSQYTTKQKALDTLAKCASDNNSYYFPYDGEALRTVFKNIASSLASELQGGSARLTN